MNDLPKCNLIGQLSRQKLAVCYIILHTLKVAIYLIFACKKYAEFITDDTSDITMMHEASVVDDDITREGTVHTPEEYNNTDNDNNAQQESHENTIQYSLIMPEQGDVQESMFEDTPVDNSSITGLFYIQHKP